MAAMAAPMLLVDVPEHTLDVEMHDTLADHAPNALAQDPAALGPGQCQDSPGPAPEHSNSSLLRVEQRQNGTLLSSANARVPSPPHAAPKRPRRPDSGLGGGIDYDEDTLDAPKRPRAHRRILPPRRPRLERSRRARRPLLPPRERELCVERTKDVNGDNIYPDFWPSKEERELQLKMADLDIERQRDKRGGGGGGGGNPRKRRFREDDDERFDRGDRGGYGRPQRKRFEEPTVSRLRKGYLTIADGGMRNPQVETNELAKGVVANFEDPDVKGGVIDLAIQMCLEQPLKIPFVAATILYMNEGSAEVAAEALARAGEQAQEAVNVGSWRTFKLLLRLFACLQGILEGDGVFPVLEQLFNAAVDLQTGSQEDSFGLELVRIILLTLPYAVAAANGELDDKATAFLSNTEVIATAQHPLEALVEAYHGDDEMKPFGFQSVIGLLQKQLANEAANGWALSIIPRPYKPSGKTANGEANGEQNGDGAGDKDGDAAAAAEEPDPPKKHALPAISIPATPNPGPKPHFPGAYFSLYADQAVKSVPPTDNIAASLIRDTMVDTINILDYNRTATAKLLIELDCFWAPDTFARRATPFDKLSEVADGKSTWKPEDMAVDAIFSQMVTLPAPEHKLVYYHSVVTETCKIAPAAIAPSLGRAIRFMFRHLDVMDMELSYRFVDWFAHHLSNFEFRWKWAEWTDEVAKSGLYPKKAFIISSLDKEIRLSFAKRIRETLPKEYHPLVSEGKEKDVPDFKFNNPQTPYAREGQAMLQLLKARKPESDVQEFVDRINAAAAEHNVAEPLVASTDAYVTCICLIGSKSLSHVLSCIERCKDRLLNLEPDAARRQIITSVVEYWKDQPGNAVNIVDKLLNYTIVSPEGVVTWALGQGEHGLGDGSGLADGWRYEMVAGTVGKVTNRVRQIVAARIQAKSQGLPDDQIKMLDDTLHSERAAMRALFGLIEDVVGAIADGASDVLLEAEGQRLTEHEAGLVRGWGEKWARVFRRKAAVEETVVSEMSVAVALAAAPEPAPPGEADGDAEAEAEAPLQADDGGAALANGDAAGRDLAKLVGALDAAAAADAAAEASMDVA